MDMRWYRHVEQIQIDRILKHLSFSGYDINLEKVRYRRKCCDKIYIIEKGFFGEISITFSCGEHPNYVYFKILPKIKTCSYEKIESLIREKGLIFEILEPFDNIEANSTDLVLLAVYKDEYSDNSFGKFLKIFRKDFMSILEFIKTE